MLLSDEADDSLLAFRIIRTGWLFDFVLISDAGQYLAGTFVSRCLLYGRDDVIVVEILGTEDINVGTALVTLGGFAVAIEMSATLFAFGSTFLFLGQAIGILAGLLLEHTLLHTIYILHTEARGQDSHLDTLAQFGVYGNTPYPSSPSGARTKC